MTDKKVYCGSGKKRSDTWLSITINPDKLQGYIEEFNGSKFVKLNINIKNEPDQFGKDVSVSIDTFKPKDTGKKIDSGKKYETDLPF